MEAEVDRMMEVDTEEAMEVDMVVDEVVEATTATTIIRTGMKGEQGLDKEVEDLVLHLVQQEKQVLLILEVLVVVELQIMLHQEQVALV